MKKNKGLLGGILEFGGNVIGKVMDTTLSITDKISRKLFGDRITDAVETPLKAVENAGKITAGKIGELSEKLEQEAAKYEKAAKTDMHYLPDNPASNIAKGKANAPLTNDITGLHYLPDNPASNIAKGKANAPLTNDITGLHYLPDNPASNIAKGKANAPLTNDIGNLINSKTAGSSALAGPAGNLAQDIDLNK